MHSMSNKPQHLTVFVCPVVLFGDNLSFQMEDFFIRRLLMVINIYMYTESRKPKFRLDVMYIDCISQAGRISVCFDQIKKSANIDV